MKHTHRIHRHAKRDRERECVCVIEGRRGKEGYPCFLFPFLFPCLFLYNNTLSFSLSPFADRPFPRTIEKPRYSTRTKHSIVRTTCYCRAKMVSVWEGAWAVQGKGQISPICIHIHMLLHTYTHISSGMMSGWGNPPIPRDCPGVLRTFFKLLQPKLSNQPGLALDSRSDWVPTCPPTSVN